MTVNEAKTGQIKVTDDNGNEKWMDVGDVKKGESVSLNDVKLVGDATYELTSMMYDNMDSMFQNLQTIATMLRTQGTLSDVSKEDVTDMITVIDCQRALINGLLSTEQLTDDTRAKVLGWLTSQGVWSRLNDAEERLHERQLQRKTLDTIGERDEGITNEQA